MEPITLGVLGFGAYMLLKNGIGGGGAAVPDFTLSPTTDRIVVLTDDKGLAQGASLFHFEADIQGVGFFAANPGAFVGIITRADLSITDSIWGAGAIIGAVNAPGANPKACAVSWDPDINWYPETASDQLADGVTYRLTVESAFSATGQRYLRYALAQGGAVIRDTGMFPDSGVYDPAQMGLVIVQVFASSGTVRFTNALWKWSKFTG